MYEGGEIDVASLFSEDVKEAIDSQDALNDQIQLTQELSVYYVGFSSDKPPFDDPLVRRAFMLAIDREKLIKDLFTGSREVAHGFMPQGLPGFNPSIAAIPYDPEEALRLLATSSYGSAEELPSIIYTTSGVVVEGSTVDLLLKMWKKNLGIQVQPRVLDETTYFYYLSQRRDNMYDYGWIADYPDPHNFMDVLFHSGAENNVGNFSNSKVDTLLEKARMEQDNQVRYDLYRKAEKLVVDEAAAIPLNFGRSYIATKPYVKGLVFTPLGMMDLKRVTLGAR
jgi:oligopeptide transport system substrate-binding protein